MEQPKDAGPLEPTWSTTAKFSLDKALSNKFSLSATESNLVMLDSNSTNGVETLGKTRLVMPSYTVPLSPCNEATPSNAGATARAFSLDLSDVSSLLNTFK